MSTVDASALRNSIRRELPAAISQSNLSPLRKFRMRLALSRPDVREAVEDYLEETAAANAIGDGDLLKMILDHLPEIIKLIELIVGLF